MLFASLAAPSLTAQAAASTDETHAARKLVITKLLQELGRTRMPVQAAIPSVITLKPAIRYQFKTGQRDWPET
jgi:hypothetical protein